MIMLSCSGKKKQRNETSKQEMVLVMQKLIRLHRSGFFSASVIHLFSLLYSVALFFFSFNRTKRPQLTVSHHCHNVQGKIFPFCFVTLLLKLFVLKNSNTSLAFLKFLQIS